MTNSSSSISLKTCKRCLAEKPETKEFFYWHKRDGAFWGPCKQCHSEMCKARNIRDRAIILVKNKERYARNKTEVLAAQKHYYQRNKERIAEQGRAYRAANRDAIIARRIRYRKNNLAKILDSNRRRYQVLKSEGRQYDWRRANADRARANHRNYCKEWLKDGRRRLSHTIAVLMNRALRQGKDGASWEALVGYTREDLIRHMERQFTKGMTWANYGEWHIDHIVPKSSFKFQTPQDPEFKACWALTNLQPLWGITNMIKKDKRLYLI